VKKRARAIEYSRGNANRRRLYCELMAATRATLAALQETGKRVPTSLLARLKPA
jgi:hypothetical protein